MKNLITRTISGIVFIVILGGSILINEYTFTALFFIISMGSLYEFYKLISNYNFKPNKIAGFVVGAFSYLIAISVALKFIDPNFIYLIFPLGLIILFEELYSHSEKPFIHIALTLTGVLYAVVPFILFVIMGITKNGYQWQLLLGYLFLQWSCDTGQYCAGMLFGKRRLFERISPKKSWEGFIGGFIITIIIGYIISIYYHNLNSWQWMTMGAIVTVTGTYGDLTESLLKRSTGVKDSGMIMPGHGGFLDRFDALIGSAPFILCYLKLLEIFS